ncbi:MAG: hypothetical protein DMG05_09155 [Acidobacteria bacterium]|nr:MAG: hypothetical protein AUI36_13045 [Cyanobacteria bacterium 13_1_40CM_2_61_4]PYV90814.1 MAG: hypothetical protein DMG05_09155 [Acidobacteriota bacterium]
MASFAGPKRGFKSRILPFFAGIFKCINHSTWSDPALYNFDLLSGLSAGLLDLTINTRPTQLAKNSNHITKDQADNWSNVSIQYFCREVM